MTAVVATLYLGAALGVLTALAHISLLLHARAQPEHGHIRAARTADFVLISCASAVAAAYAAATAPGLLPLAG